ncbi:hypothetical protein R1sor_006847 [Riccia sorocarpa]|uniref:HRDC domain-containing protein n=1 Tax=Riccia sorocarpa TaxID=122646 RepID=A0ABD3HQI1_9MARC
MVESKGVFERKLVTLAIAVSSLTVVSVGILHARRRKRNSGGAGSLYVAKCEEKPQRRFRRILADNSFAPFVHLQTEENDIGSGHPFGQSIRWVLERSPPKFLLDRTYELPAGLDGSYQWVDTREKLETLASLLKNETEFAVDTEQHSYHSFDGFTALVQISTRETDYLVDTIALHDDMSILQDVFSNTAICKVFHGADSDILWLQRDFHIYVVNMFDTAKACSVLNKPHRSLAYLLKIYCDVTTNKAFQRADWRIRPLTEEMVEYARTDAHYLLYIAHELGLELTQQKSGETEKQNPELGVSVEGSLLEEAWRRSNLNCLQLFEKEGVADATATATTLVTRFRYLHGSPPPSQLDHNQEHLVIKLCEWRDRVARAEDESLRAVLSDGALIALASICPQTLEMIQSTVAAADASLQSTDEYSSPVKPTFDSPSPTLVKHVVEICNIIRSWSSTTFQEVSLTQTEAEANPRNYFAALMDKLYSALNLGPRRDAFLESYSIAEKDDEYISRNGTLGDRKTTKEWRRNAGISRMQFVKKFSCKAPVYHNCRIYADDGRLLCFCDRKKLDWYVKRGLAEFVQEDPPAVRLLFEPKGRPEDENNEFYIQSKSNRCVGCGESSHYLRYRIIPSCYRQHFPEYLKSHRSHDIVLLCVDCHEAAHKAAEKHKKKIAKEFGVPLFAKVLDAEGEQNQAAFADAEGEKGVSPLQLKNAAMALLRHGSTIPTQRREALEEVIKAYFGRETITQQDLKAALLVSMGAHERRRLSKRILAQGSNNANAAELVTRDDGSLPSSQDERLTPSGVETCTPSTQDDSIQEKNAEAQQMPPSPSSSVPSGDYMDRIILESLSAKRVSYRHKGRKNDSLLGHAAHGRRVVEIIMKQGGEDGIRVFCQEWRTVFVEALQPAFLPPGWDISHSGRREFGDFSVYKHPSSEEQSTS